MRRSNFLILLYLVLIFGSGVVVGAFVTHLYAVKTVSAKAPAPRMTPEEFRRQYTTDMQQHLGLTPDQMTKLNVVLDDTGARVHAEHQRHNLEMKTIHDEQVSKTRALLTAAQLPEYEKLRKEREERFRHARGK